MHADRLDDRQMMDNNSVLQSKFSATKHKFLAWSQLLAMNAHFTF